MPTLDQLRTALTDAKREARNLSVIAMRPNLDPQKREGIKQLERSARAEIALRQKALDCALSQQAPKRPAKE